MSKLTKQIRKFYSTIQKQNSLYLLDSEGLETSFWQSPAVSKDNWETVQCVAEIPNVFSKLYVNKEKRFHPIEQDTRPIQGKLAPRFYQQSLMFNYGFIPQTYESPLKKDVYTNKYHGDNDPLDVIEVSPMLEFLGEHNGAKDLLLAKIPFQCVILGSFCLIDQNETDWKMILLERELAEKNQLFSIEALKARAPGYMEYLIHCFKFMKYQEGQLVNHIEFNEKIFNAEETKDIIRHYHQEYIDFLTLEHNKNLRVQFHVDEISDSEEI
jgi:inorganic pyrophosphatase